MGAPRHERAWIELLAVEEFVLEADRVLEPRHLAHAALGRQRRIPHLDLDPRGAELGHAVEEGHPPYGFPTDIGELVDRPRMEGEPVAPIVHPQIERVRFIFR